MTPSPLYPDIPPVVGKHVSSFFFDTVSFSCRQSFKFTRSKHLKTKLLPATTVDGKYMMPVLGKWDFAEYMQARKETATDVFFTTAKIQTLSPKLVGSFRAGNLPRMILVQLTESRWFECRILLWS